MPRCLVVTNSFDDNGDVNGVVIGKSDEPFRIDEVILAMPKSDMDQQFHDDFFEMFDDANTSHIEQIGGSDIDPCDAISYTYTLH